MLKAKKLFLSIMVVSIFVIGIFSLTSCNRGDDSGKIIDKENFSTIKNDYQLYKESKPQVMPEGEDIVIDGANYDINGVTTDSAGNVTSIIEIDVSKDKLNPTNGTQELKKLVECFVDIDQSGYSQNDYQYIYDCIFDGHSSIQITNGTKKAILDKMESVPSVEKEYVDFKRQQEIYQAVYLILLQKREEIALSINNQRDRARIIDAAFVKQRPVAPRKLFAVLGILAFTLILPVGVLFIKEQFIALKSEFNKR